MANRSIFPKGVDTFQEMYDLPPSLVTSAKRLQELKIKPSLSSIEQAEVVELVKSLARHMITPENFNKFQDALVNMQTFILTEVNDYIGDKQDEWTGMITNFSLKGEYDSSKQYYFQNMVTYNGSLYICKADTKGNAPTNAVYWERISEKGDKGDVGVNTNFKGDFVNTRAYELGDAVMYNGSLYYAKNNTTGNLPTNTLYWFCFDKHFVSASQPQSVQNGTVWIETT